MSLQILEPLPPNPDERSQLLKRLLEEYYQPKKPESELVELKLRVEALERRFGDGVGGDREGV